MAGAMRKMAVYLGLVEGDDGYDEYDQDIDRPMDDYERVVEAQRVRRPDYSSGATETAPVVRVVAPQAGLGPAVIESGRISTMHPRTYNDARGIGLEYREGTPVIMNLTDLDDTDAKRLIDFAAGLVFGQRGKLERITNKVFLLSPANVDVTAQAEARVAEGGFFNQS